ncbi:hypothetical protein COCCADRAFT_111159, partial [Bipolaris zeicola 26-R-13]
NWKYETRCQAKEARKACNRKAQRRYREKLKMKKITSYASPSDSTTRDEIEEEPPTAVDPPGADAQEVSTGMEDVSNQRREPDPPSISLTLLERVARIEQDVDRLLVSVEDLNVKKSLQSPIARVNPKFKDLVSRVYQGQQQPAVPQKPSVVPRMHYNPHASTGNPAQGLWPCFACLPPGYADVEMSKKVPYGAIPVFSHRPILHCITPSSSCTRLRCDTEEQGIPDGQHPLNFQYTWRVEV